jgi:hypothetical protein
LGTTFPKTAIVLQKDRLDDMVGVRAEHTNRRKRPTRIDFKGP